ncbi:MAG: 23S rRNA (guanosine(2251)-2'-O)-methyltransferase RlmB, partial [Thermodesulfobacteriota bacterium]
VRIPTLGRVSSLNASVAAAVIMFEVLRQRGAARGE